MSVITLDMPRLLRGERRRPATRATAACLMALGLVALQAELPIAGSVRAQQTSTNAERSEQKAAKIELRLPSVIVAEAASEVALDVTLSPADDIPKNSLLRVRGLPPSVAILEGHAIAPGTWAVPMASVPRLRLSIPAGTSGKSDVSVLLVTIDGGILAEAKTALVVGNTAKLIAPETPSTSSAAVSTPPSPPQAPAVAATRVQPGPSTPPASPVIPPPPSAAAESARSAANSQKTIPPPPPRRGLEPVSPPPAAAKSLPVLTPEARSRAQSMVQRGETLRRDGDIASARLFFERAADAGLAEGALALGATYDPHELAALKVHGMRADPAMARRWYERARELGHTEAAQRLARLGT